MLEPFQSFVWTKPGFEAVEAPAQPLQVLQVKHKYKIGGCHARTLLCARAAPYSVVHWGRE